MTLTEFEIKLLDSITDLCKRLTKLEENFHGHIEDLQKKEKSKREKIYIVITIVSTMTAVASTIVATSQFLTG